jgi:FixJ family two-component response regulator
VGVGSGESTPTRASDGSFVSPALLIDDNLTQLRIREAVLREAGLSVSCVSTAEQALSFARSAATGPGVIVTNHVLPRASDSAFGRQPGETCPRVPLTVISGTGRPGASTTACRVHFLRKPCPPECLIREVPTPSHHLICHPERREALAERVEGPLACWRYRRLTRLFHDDCPSRCPQHKQIPSPRPMVRTWTQAITTAASLGRLALPGLVPHASRMRQTTEIIRPKPSRCALSTSISGPFWPPRSTWKVPDSDKSGCTLPVALMTRF